MKNNWGSLAILSVIAMMLQISVAQAQGSAVDQDVDQELDQMYSQQNSVQSPRVQGELAPQGAGNGQPIYILNQATPSSTAQVQSSQAATQVQKQPTTIVQASPLTESRAEQMRRARQETELQTESKIVEKLESSRMEDEKRRADVLFGDKFNGMQNRPSESAPVVAPVPVQVIQAQPETNTRDIVREEINAALKAESEAPEETIHQSYFGGSIGVLEIPDATNVKGNYSLGVTFGSRMDNNFAVEGSFFAANSTMNPVFYPTGYVAPNMDVNAYSGAVAFKFLLLSGMVRPVLGGLVQYTYRTYAWSNKNNSYGPYYGGYGYNNINTNETSTNSHAVDLGAIAGLDFDVNSKFSLGLDYRYLFNVYSRRNTGALVYQPYYGTPLESMNSYVLSLSARALF